VSHKRAKATGAYSGTILWGGYDGDARTGASGLFPIYHYRNQGAIGAAIAGNARYGDFGKDFWSLPACWYRNQAQVRPEYAAASSSQFDPRAKLATPTNIVTTRVRAHGFFPLWSYSAHETAKKGSLDVDASLLLWLYDYQHKVNPVAGQPGATNDYVRSRVLWRVWHHERTNGDVSVDLFPGITYDRKRDGFKKVSFLWRLFRYENGKDGRKLDLLYIPVVRGRG
jgi:hypothetical protein